MTVIASLSSLSVALANDTYQAQVGQNIIKSTPPFFIVTLAGVDLDRQAVCGVRMVGGLEEDHNAEMNLYDMVDHFLAVIFSTSRYVFEDEIVAPLAISLSGKDYLAIDAIVTDCG